MTKGWSEGVGSEHVQSWGGLSILFILCSQGRSIEALARRLGGGVVRKHVIMESILRSTDRSMIPHHPRSAPHGTRNWFEEKQ
jgi:hypothetical protein